MKISSEKQLKKDLKYLKKHLENDKESINQVMEHIEKIGVGSAEYFCEEFVFIPDGEEPEEVARPVSYTHLTLPTSDLV